MSTPLVEVRIEGMQALERAVQDYRALIKDDAGKALAKAARLTTLALHREFRKQPPRPSAGSIASAAQSRGYRLNVRSRSYATGMASANKILGSARSGYFRIQASEKGLPVAYPVLVGARGRIVTAKYKKNAKTTLLTSESQLAGMRKQDRAAYRKLLSGNRRAETFEARRRLLRERLNDTRIPEDAVRLNRSALAAARTITIREKAAAGGYLASQFLAYKGVRGVGETKFLTKDGKLAGTVAIKGDTENDEVSATVTGYLEGTARIAERHGIVGKALVEAASVYRADMIERINRRSGRLGGRR